MRVSYNFYQPLYDLNGIGVELFGAIAALYNVFASLGAILYSKIFKSKNDNENSTIIIISLFLFITIVGIQFTSGFTILIMIFIQQFVRGIVPSYFILTTNAYIPRYSKFRTTYLSLKNFINTILTSWLIFIIGIINDIFDLRTTFFLFGIFVIFLIIVLTVIFKLLKQKGSIVKYN